MHQVLFLSWETLLPSQCSRFCAHCPHLMVILYWPVLFLGIFHFISIIQHSVGYSQSSLTGCSHVYIFTDVQLYQSTLFPLRQGLSMNLDLTGFSQMDRPVSWVSLPIPFAEVRGACSHTYLFTCGSKFRFSYLVYRRVLSPLPLLMQ